jgi:D-alanine transaminase
MTTVYLNGDFMPIEQARVPVMDRGFLFGDGVYEVIPVYGGRLFRFQHHIERLQNSLDGIRLVNPLSDSKWEQMLTTLLQNNGIETDSQQDYSVYLQVTRGVSEKRDHLFPANIIPTVYASSQPIAPVAPAIIEHGIAVITLEASRWARCNIKASTLLPNVLLRQEAQDNDASEAILIRDGNAIEGSASNLFVVKNSNIMTPPKGTQLLPGITRDLVLELAQQHGLKFQESNIDVDTLKSADEIWITSSTREIVPVTRLDGQPVGDGKPGPSWRKMVEYYRIYKDDVRSGRAA